MQALCRVCVGFSPQTLHSATCGESARYKENVGFCVGFAEFLFPYNIRIVKCEGGNKKRTPLKQKWRGKESGESVSESGASGSESGASVSESGASVSEGGASVSESGASVSESGASVSEYGASCHPGYHSPSSSVPPLSSSFFFSMRSSSSGESSSS